MPVSNATLLLLPKCRHVSFPQKSKGISELRGSLWSSKKMKLRNINSLNRDKSLSLSRPLGTRAAAIMLSKTHADVTLSHVRMRETGNVKFNHKVTKVPLLPAD